jgi:hypothetical protein
MRPGVLWKNQRPHARSNPVCGQQHVPTRCTAVFEMGHDFVGPILDCAETLAVRDSQTVSGHLVEQDLMKGGTADCDADARPAHVEAADDPAVMIAETELARWWASGRHPVRKAKGAQDSHAVGRDLKAAADGCGFMMGFETLGFDAATLEEQ